MPENKYDVFISYSHKDSDWVVETLVPRLEDAGLRVCIDSRDFVVGKAAILNMQDGILQSDHILLLLTPNWIRSDWTKFEAELGQVDDPNGVKSRIIPVLWKKCKIPKHLSLLTYADFTNEETQDDAWYQLLTSLGIPEDKIRRPRAVQTVPEQPPEVEVITPRIHKTRDLLVFLAILVVLITMVVLVALYGDLVFPVHLPTSSVPTASLTETLQKTATDEPSPTRTVSPTDTESPTDTPPAATFTPTTDPTCINASQWTAFTSSLSIAPVLMADHCYDLNQMGISLDGGIYSFYLYGTNRADFYGITSRVDTNTTITLTFKVREIRDGEFWVGISQTENPEQEGVYFVAREDGLFDIRVYSQGHWSIDTAGISIPFNTAKTYDLQLKLSGNKLTISINNGGWSYPPVQVPFSERMLFIGMRPYATGLVNVDVSNVSIP